MSISEEYQPINCDDYDNLELACQQHWILTLTLRDGKEIVGKACDLLLRKKVEYMILETTGQQCEVRLDHIHSFSHPEIGTILMNNDN